MDKEKIRKQAHARREKWKEEISRIKNAAAARRQLEIETWKRSIKPILDLTRTIGFHDWFGEHSRIPWTEEFIEDRFTTLITLEFRCFLELFEDFTSFEEAKKFIVDYRTPEKLFLLAWERRQKRVKDATPQWVDFNEIKSLESRRSEYNALYPEDAPWHIDHIVPLSGELVCGLHVHGNMQLLPGRENMRKNNKFDI